MPPMKVIDVKPVYPEQMRASGDDAVVILDAVIGTDGMVRDIEPAAGGSASPEFESAAIEAVRQWEFTPTYLNCTPIDVHMQATIRFVAKR